MTKAGRAASIGGARRFAPLCLSNEVKGSIVADTVKKPRPEFRNIGIGQILTAYRLPLAGRVSILHRVSGGLLFV
ncbi:MAG: Succinate dehydrogenase cytochrome b-556 subunit, partial [uncultured Paraburkholderia sp.]